MSVRCIRCGLFNSFSFSTKQTTCIKCGASLDQDDITASKMHLDNINNRDFKSFNKPWERIEDSHVIKGV